MAGMYFPMAKHNSLQKFVVVHAYTGKHCNREKSISLGFEKRWFNWWSPKGFQREFRLTLFGIALHYRRH